VGADDATPIGEAHQHGQHRGPAKPPQSARHKAGEDFAFGGRIKLFHERDVNEVKEIQQAQPGDATDEMQPAEQHEKVGVEVGGKVDVGTFKAPILQSVVVLIVDGGRRK